LGDVADIIGGGTPNTSIIEYWGDEIDWYAPAEIGEQIYLTGSQKKITEIGLQHSSARILPVGTVLFTSRAGIGNTAILTKIGATNQGFQSIVPHKNELDSYFIFSRTHELKRYGETVGAGSTFTEVSGKQMARMPVMVPKMPEQMKIGEFFKQLDNLITLHQREPFLDIQIISPESERITISTSLFSSSWMICKYVFCVVVILECPSLRATLAIDTPANNNSEA